MKDLSPTFKNFAMSTRKFLHSKIARQESTTTIALAGADSGKDQPSQAFEVKLPKLLFLHYRGELTQRQTIWEQFHAAAHRNTGLAEGQTFYNLRSL